ncbi:MAG: alpha/beta fold hydrolase [Planctomycetota bacterium]|jgi:pimeloyl-ACP methyl ester carboxylesterase
MRHSHTASIIVCFALTSPALAQDNPQPAQQDPSLNNLVHPEGYQTVELGTLGDITVVADGPQPIVLIPGWGFDASIFDPIIDSDSNQFTYHIATPAGYADTPAPPMPPEGTSYGERTWWSAFEHSLWNELEARDIESPILLTFLDGAQSAVLLASSHPGAVRAIITIAGLPQMEFQGTIPKDMRPQLMDTRMAEGWFKTVTQTTWDNGMGSPQWYSENPDVGTPLYNQSLVSPVSNMVRYYCEHWATDVTEQLATLDVPILEIMPDRNDAKSDPLYQGFVTRALVTPWETAASANENITIKELPATRMGLMHTHTGQVLEAINVFLTSLN